MNARLVRFGSGKVVAFSKHGNKKCERQGIKFDSQREAKRWDDLRILQTAGRIRHLQPSPEKPIKHKYELRVAGLLIATYTPDYEYEELVHGAWVKVTEDSKGWPNDRWPMKKKLMKACHGIDVRVT